MDTSCWTCAFISLFVFSIALVVGREEFSSSLDLFNEENYDKWIRPNSSGEPTVVHTKAFIYFLSSIEAQNLQYSVHILIRYRWVDERLKHNKSVLEGEENLREKLWTPHVYLVNEHESKIMGSGKEDVIVTIGQDGTVLYSLRLKVRLLCIMNLSKFPFDNQICPLELESWAYNTDNLLLKWEEDAPILMENQLLLTEYSILPTSTHSSTNSYSKNPEDLKVYNSKFSGNYSCLTVQFHLKREVGHYIMDYYVPSILLVIVSFVSFWLDPNAVPGRITLGTSTMLTFITLSRNIGSSLPKVSYIKATEYWFMMCTVFIFGSLVEFAFVNSIWRRRNNVAVKKKTTKNILKSLTPQLKRREIFTIASQSSSSIEESKSHTPNNITRMTLSTESISKDPVPVKIHRINDKSEPQQPQHKRLLTMTPQEIAQWIDKRSRLVFPLLFIICNAFYWVTLLC